MKKISVNVKFRHHMKELEESLSKTAAKDLKIERTYGGDIGVSFILRYKDTEELVKRQLLISGAQNIMVSRHDEGARYDFELEGDETKGMTESQCKKWIINVLGYSGFDAYD